MLEVKNLVKKFGDFTALDDVSFSAKVGEIITLLGPNGAGKSTLIRCICGYLKQNSGNVYINQNSLEDNFEKYLSEIGYMPENTPLYGEMKVFEYLQFIAGIYKMSKDEFVKNLQLVTEKLEISSVLKQKISTLSKGYKRRVGIAAAILHEPAILILDEPTEGLDPNQKITLRKFLVEYSKTHLVFISTHLLEEAESLSSRVIILNHGKLIKDTTAKEMKKEAEDKSLSELFYKLTNPDGVTNVE